MLENLGQRRAELLRQAGHDVATVIEQGLQSTFDPDLIKVCLAEERCLVTLDLDFSNPLCFDPAEYAGIVVLRLPGIATPQDLLDAFETLIGALETEEVTGKLWIIQRGRLRVYQQE